MSVAQSETIRKKFTPEEDNILRDLVKRYGAKKWIEIAKAIPGRTGRQCRDRFQNYLSPSLTNGPWTKEDDLLLLQKVRELGSSWSKIIPHFPGRSPNNIKNRYNIHLSKHINDVDQFKAQNGEIITQSSEHSEISFWDTFKPDDELSSPGAFSPLTAGFFFADAL